MSLHEILNLNLPTTSRCTECLASPNELTATTVYSPRSKTVTGLISSAAYPDSHTVDIRELTNNALNISEVFHLDHMLSTIHIKLRGNK